MIDPVTRWIISACAGLALLCVVWLHGQHRGGERVHEKWDASVARGNVEIERLKGEAGKVTVRVETKYVDRVVTVKGETREIIRKVPVFVPAGACELPAGFRVFHDAAAEGSVPDAAAIAHGAPVDAQTVAATVADNYGTCRILREQVIGWQQWAREQQLANPEQ